MTIALDSTVEHLLAQLCDLLKNYPAESLAPYEEFALDGNTYYFSPGGFLYRKGECGSEEVGGLFANSLIDEFWHYITDHS